jgi:hypothetical protein
MLFQFQGAEISGKEQFGTITDVAILHSTKLYREWFNEDKMIGKLSAENEEYGVTSPQEREESMAI